MSALDLDGLRAERDAARHVVRQIHWMARRYADGRQSYAAGMFNDAVRPAFEAGWLTWKNTDEPQYARDGMFSPEWQSIEQRARIAEEKVSALEREVMQEREKAAQHAECAFDVRPNSRAGHHSEMDWTDGYRDGTRAAATAIRAALNPNHSSEGASS